MAIIVPSKHIFNKENPKVRDNIIDRIEVSAVKVVPNNLYEVLVFSNKETITEKSLTDYGYGNDVGTDYPSATTIRYIAQYTSCKLFYYNLDLKIPILGENKYISKIYDWKKEITETNSEPNGVQYSLIGRKKTQPFSATFTFTNGGKSGTSSNFQYQTITVGDTERITLPQIKSNGFIDSLPIGLGIKDETNISIIVTEDKENYNVSGSVLIGMEFEIATGWTAVGNLVSPDPITINGEKTIYEIDEIEFSIFGDTIGIELQENTIYIPDEDRTSKKVFSVSRNELMQTENHISNSALRSIKSAFSKTKINYETGKETAVLKCSISDYFDEIGELAISADGKVGATPDRMTFRNGDEVIPMVCGVDGKDRPLSQKNGLPKVFKVLGVKCFYDGAVWQEISLQEV